MSYTFPLNEVFQQIDALIQKNVTAHSPEFTDWKTIFLLRVSKCFGYQSYEYNKFEQINFNLSISSFDVLPTDTHQASQWLDDKAISDCRKGLLQVKKLLSLFISDQENKSYLNSVKGEVYMRRNRRDLKPLIDEAEILILDDVVFHDIPVQTWNARVCCIISDIFGSNSIELSRFKSICYEPDEYYGENNIMHAKDIEACRKGLKKAKALLSQFMKATEEEDENMTLNKNDYSKVFIVHGHDGELRENVARIIEKQDIKAIILSEQANQGRTIIEKIEKNSDVGGAICLFTADDVGKEKNKEDSKPRARQNVVFEAGYFMGKLGRDHIVILADEGIEMPSDLQGVVYTNTANWQANLLQEMNAMGYSIDFNKLYR